MRDGPLASFSTQSCRCADHKSARLFSQSYETTTDRGR